MAFDIKIEGGDEALEILKVLKEGLRPEKIDFVVERRAAMTLKTAIERTPKKWFGQVRRSWMMKKEGPAHHVVRNDNKIMLFLEEGTRAHGPVTAKALFIPLTRKAVVANKEFRKELVSAGPGFIKVRRQVPNKGGGLRTTVTTLKFGVDYILVKRVKGITPRRIAERVQIEAANGLQQDAVDYVNLLIRQATS